MSPYGVSAHTIRGGLKIRCEADSTGRTFIAERQHQGAFHLSKPYWDGRVLLVQWVNPTAGIFAGDELVSEVHVGENASLLLTTPSATRIHTRSSPDLPPGRQQQHFQVARQGWLEVLPEWLIPQRGSAFEQVTTIEVSADAGLFYAELLAPGRVAHGESLAFELLDNRLRLSIDGRLVCQQRTWLRPPDRLWPCTLPGWEHLYSADIWVVAQEAPAPILPTHFMGCLLGTTTFAPNVFAHRLIGPSSWSIRSALREIRCAYSQICPKLQSDARKF